MSFSTQGLLKNTVGTISFIFIRLILMQNIQGMSSLILQSFRFYQMSTWYRQIVILEKNPPKFKKKKKGNKQAQCFR